MQQNNMGSTVTDGAHRVGVFGGSFDPIHVGHLIVAEILRHSLHLSEVIFLPAARAPHKPNQAVAADADRLAMIERCIRDVPGFVLSRVDVDRGGYSYTVDSLRLLRGAYPNVREMYFLMGQDSLRDFPTWHSPGEIARQARLGVALRPDVKTDIAVLEERVPELRGRVELVPVPLIGVSSSDIRRRVRQNHPFRFQVMPAVADYINARGLYRGNDGEAS